jgi:diguanylate cyclase (GGDEF)-like protein/PAS domain S-box-containing protein
MTTAVRLLIVRGAADDADRIVHELRSAGQDPTTAHVQTTGELTAALERDTWDAVLIYSSAPHGSLVALAAELRRRGLDLPLVALTPRADTEEVVAAMKAGATHCLAGGELWRLPAIVLSEILDASHRRTARAAEDARRSAEERHRGLLEEIPACTYLAWADGVGSTAFVGPQVKALTGVSPEEWLADPELWAKQIHPEDRDRVLAEYRRSTSTGEPFVSEYRVLAQGGRVVWWRDEGRVFQDVPGRGRLVGGVVVDITSRRQAEDALRHTMHRDPLTGLADRVLLQQRLQETLERSRQDRQPLALLLIDLDSFREVNNTLGHANGDLVIQEVAARLGDVLGGPDRTARLRGDEFAVLLPDAEAAFAYQVAAKVLSALETPIMVERLPIEVGASIGIAVAPKDGTAAEEILRKADLAMQAAKKRRSGVVVYTPECDLYNPGGLLLLGELRRALEAEQLQLHYQPKIDLRSGSVIGAEALARWRHPKRGLVPPDEFIPLAERGGLIKAFTRWVLDSALAQCDAWRGRGTRLPVSVNLSAHNLQDAQLLDDVPEMLQRRRLGPEFLELEITETAVMADAPRAAENLRGLRAHGVGLAIDDFGTGYSSLVYLRKLPVSQLKIDKSFVIGMAAHEGEDEIIVRSTTDLGHHLGLKVVAEGVEDRRTFDRLHTLGCDAAQGFYMARPMPASEIEPWLRQSPWRLGEAP